MHTVLARDLAPEAHGELLMNVLEASTCDKSFMAKTVLAFEIQCFNRKVDKTLTRYLFPDKLQKELSPHSS